MVRRTRDDLTLAFLATPTDVFAVPGEAVEQSVATYESRSAPHRDARPRTPRAQRRPAAAPGLPPRRGPRASATPWCRSRVPTTPWPSGCSDGGPPSRPPPGGPVSMNVAPPTRTRSVVKNRALAAAYAGAHRFGVTVFEPVDHPGPDGRAAGARPVRRPAPCVEHPWQAEAHQAVHGGLWRVGVRPPQRARSRRPARLRRRPLLTPRCHILWHLGNG